MNRFALLLSGLLLTIPTLSQAAVPSAAANPAANPAPESARPATNPTAPESAQPTAANPAAPKHRCAAASVVDRFPDGKPISDWFRETERPDSARLGRRYVVTDYGVQRDSLLLQTEALQAVIDRAAREGGGVVVIPRGVFLSASLFFRPGTHLWLERGAVLKGSDDIGDFPVVRTRIEGRTIDYFPALVNADSLDGFTIAGEGTLDGNGLRYWKSFWKRRAVDRKCTNIAELRPRLLYLSNCTNARVDGITIRNSPFWSTHYYRCAYLKLTDLRITSPYEPVKSPSTDAIDLDVCHDVLIKGCYLSVNDDAIALKGGKGPWADRDPDNGAVCDVLIEECTFGFCHSTLTCGSECIHARNILHRRCKVHDARLLLNLKLRPDTPQRYEYITVEDASGDVKRVLHIAPWRQFFDLGDRKEMPLSYAEQVTLRRLDLDCEVFFAVQASEQYRLRDFYFEKLDIRASKNGAYDPQLIPGSRFEQVTVSLPAAAPTPSQNQ